MDEEAPARGPTREETSIQAPGEALGATVFTETPRRAWEKEERVRPEPLEPASEEAQTYSSVVPIIIGSALLMQTLDSTVVMNALPVMAVSLHESPIRLDMTITVYLLASAICLPLSGWAADRFGAKKLFLIAIAAFAAACACCGFAQNLTELLVFRALPGAAGAMMGPVGRLVLLRSTPKHNLVQAMSVVTIPSLLGPVIGPVIGGAIVTYVSWRWIFFLNLPVAALGLFMVSRFIHNVKSGVTTKLDWQGLILTGVGMAGIVYGFENLGRGPMPPWAIAAMMGGGAVCLALYWRHARRIDHPIIDLGLFKVRTFTAATVGGAFMRLGMGASPFILVLLLQVAFGLTPLESGLMTFSSAAAALVMKTCAPPILARFGFKPTLSVNAFIVAIAFAAYSLFRPGTPHWVIYAVLLFGGFFRSLQFTSLNGLAFADIDNAQMSRASTMSTMGQQLSQSIGIGVAASFLHFLLRMSGQTHVSAPIIAPVYWAIAAISLISLFFYLRLPADAGEELHDRRPRRGTA